MSSMKCVLCSEVSSSIETAGYYHCGSCDLRFLDPALRLSVHEEKERYLKHNNDVSDVGYQAFVQPLVNAVCEKLPLSAKGLDFGSGAAPIVSHLLSKRGYHLEKYDPHFATDKSVLKEATYDFVVACEVVEHFHEPLKEFERMHALLKLGGTLFLQTSLYGNEIDFSQWHYRRDPTHVCFYSKRTFHWIQNKVSFSNLIIEESIISLVESQCVAVKK